MAMAAVRQMSRARLRMVARRQRPSSAPNAISFSPGRLPAPSAPRHAASSASGDGIYITDGDGKRLIDGPAGMWCVNVGHRRAELAEAMPEQAMALSYNTPWYTMNEPSAQLAERIAAHAPGDLDHVFFTTGGSSAVESALRFMQFYNNVRGRPEKKLIMSPRRRLSRLDLSVGLAQRPAARPRLDGRGRPAGRQLSSPDPFRRPAGMRSRRSAPAWSTSSATTIARVGAESIGAFIAEPVQASGGVIVPPRAI